MTSWKDVGAVTEIPVRGTRVIKTDAGCIALFRTSEDKVFALADKCPHKSGPLSEGIVHGDAVTCPLHNWVIDLATGLVKGEDEGQTKSYDIKIEEGRIFIDQDQVEASKDEARAA